MRKSEKEHKQVEKCNPNVWSDKHTICHELKRYLKGQYFKKK